MLALLPIWGLAAETTVRLRLAWGSDDSQTHRWTGHVTLSAGRFSDLQPLGIEADAPAAVLLANNQVIVDPLVKRGFDGCDVTVNAEPDATLRFALQTEQTSTPSVVEVPLSQVAQDQVRQPLDSLGSFLLAYRAPGDRLRFVPGREHLVFRPAEVWPLRLQVDFEEESRQGPVVVDATLRASGESTVLWQATERLIGESPTPREIGFDLTCPRQEGAYTLQLAAHGEEGLAARLVPGQRSRLFAAREIEIVVVDPQARLPRLTDRWEHLLSVDPANPSWWQRLPSWAQLARLRGKSVSSLGNVPLLSRTAGQETLVELPPSSDDEPTWQAFTLPIQEPGTPHLVEIVYPENVPLHLGVSIIEPDAAGRVIRSELETGITGEQALAEETDRLATHRLFFWPRTHTPQLLIVNRDPSHPGVFGQITLSRQAKNQTTETEPVRTPGKRLVASYLARPHLAQNFGAAEAVDSASGMSVQSWRTFLDATRHLVQYHQLAGYNAVVLNVAGEGSGLYPSRHLVPSPRYDTGRMAGSGQDAFHKDVLELALRICDREGLKLIPAVSLATALPRLESLRREDESRFAGVLLQDKSGRSYRTTAHHDTSIPYGYNLLNPNVQDELLQVVKELATRYQGHPSFAGVALQVDPGGYGMLPGLDWGFDQQTTQAFQSATDVPSSNAQEAWRTWRAEQLTRFYSRAAAEVRLTSSSAQLFLLANGSLDSPDLQQTVPLASHDTGSKRDWLVDRGLDLQLLSAVPGLSVANTFHATDSASFHEQATVASWNEVALRQELFSPGHPANSLFVGLPRLTHLPSYDEQSPFGVENTRLSLLHQPMFQGSPNRLLLAQAPQPSVIEGGVFLPTTLDSTHARLLRILRELPPDLGEPRITSQQPLVSRVHHTSTETLLVCANESPWRVTAQVELNATEATPWRMLDSVNMADSSIASGGQLTPGLNTWSLQLEPSDVQAWTFASPSLQLERVRVQENPAIVEYLQARIEAVEARADNLNITRQYPQLQNPGFEVAGSPSRIFGWQVGKGFSGTVELQNTGVRTGSTALHLASTDAAGVAVQSHLFPAPETGMLVVAAHVSSSQVAANAEVTLALETDSGASEFRRERRFGPAELQGGQWTRCELVVPELPTSPDTQLRLQIRVAGSADLVVDDIELCDLRFDEQRRAELVKRVYAANTALEERQVTDCLRLVNDFWPLYLIEYVPPVERDAPVLAKQPTTEKPEDRKKLGGRIRGWVPKMWR